MTWLNPSEWKDSKGRVWHISNPEWIKQLMETMKDDDDTPKDKEATKSS
jgi:hypothetical protein